MNRFRGVVPGAERSEKISLFSWFSAKADFMLWVRYAGEVVFPGENSRKFDRAPRERWALRASVRDRIDRS